MGNRSTRLFALSGILIFYCIGSPSVPLTESARAQSLAAVSPPKTLQLTRATVFGAPSFVCDEPIESFCISRTGKFAIICLKRRKAVALEVWNIASRIRITSLSIEGLPAAYAFSSNDERLGVYFLSGRIVVFSTDNWSEAARVTTNARAHSRLAFSKDRNSLLIASLDGWLHSVDLREAKLTWSVNTSMPSLTHCGILANGDAWLLGRNDRQETLVFRVDLTSRSIKQSIPVSGEYVSSAVCDGDDFLIICNAEGQLRKCDLKAGKWDAWTNALCAQQESVHAVAALQRDRVAITTNHRLVIATFSGARVEETIPGFRTARSIDSCASKGALAIADGHRLVVLDCQRPSVGATSGHGLELTTIAYDDKHIFTTDTKTLCRWPRAGGEAATLEISAHPIDGLSPSARRSIAVDGHSLYIGPPGEDTWRIVDTETMRIDTLYRGSLIGTEDLLISRAPERTLLWASAMGTFVSIDVTTRQQIHSVGTRTPSARTAIARSGALGMVLTSRERLIFYSLPKGDVVETFDIPDVTSLAAPQMLGNGDRYALAGIFKLVSQAELARHPGTEAGMNFGIVLGETAKPGQVSRIGLLRERIQSYSFSNGEKHVAIARRNGALEIWAAASSTLIATARLQEDVVTAMCWDSDNKVLFAGTRRGMLYAIPLDL